MRYFVTLNGREFPLRLERSADTGARLWAPDSPVAAQPIAAQPIAAQAIAAQPIAAQPITAQPERELAVEVLRTARQGRPALVRVDGRVFRVLSETAAVAGSARRASRGRVRVNGQALQVELET